MTADYIDLNNVTIFRKEDPCGSVETFSITQSELSLQGKFLTGDAGGWRIVAADKYRRFLVAGTTDTSGSWSLTLNLQRLHNLPANAPMVLYGLRPGTQHLYPVQMTPKLTQQIESYLKKHQDTPVDDLPSYRDIYIRDIIEATKFRYVSTSNQENILTGNNYQSLELEKVLREGTRSDRSNFLRQVKLADKTVLDIGANTGEVSRSIRLLGASLVDGVEYDSFFVETGRMINGVVGATRVSLFQGDATHPGFYAGKKYDIVVALSVYVYVKNVMKELADMTDVLVFETHTLDHGLKMYLDAVTPHFPVYQHVGYSQLSTNPRKSRAFLIFAKNQDSLSAVFQPGELKIGTYFDNKFLTEHGTTTPKKFLEWAEALKAKTDLGTLKAQRMGFGTSAYFTAYILGYLDYLANGAAVTDDNVFVQCFVDAIQKGDLDQNLKPLLKNKENLFLKIAAKFRDLDFCLAGEFHRVPLIILSLDDAGKFTFTDLDGTVLKASNIDGHHRHFIAQLLGLQSMMYMTSDRRPKFEQKIETTYTLSRDDRTEKARTN